MNGTMRTAAAVGAFMVTVGAPCGAMGQVGKTVEVPLRVVAGRLVVPVQGAGGVAFSFALSTGNGVTVFSEAGAARWGGEAELSLGGVPVPTEGSATVADDRLTDGGETLDGLIGANMLNRFDILVDVPGGRLLLKTPGPSVEWEDVALSEPLRLRVFHGMLLSVDVTLDGQTFGSMIDIGAQGVVVNPPAADKLGVTDNAAMTLTLGSTTLPVVQVRREDDPILERWDPNGAGFAILGAPIAHECAVSLSWVHREIRMCAR